MLKTLRYKLWFLFDLPNFINENKLSYGIELGAKAGRSMFWMLLKNKELSLVGIDKWEILKSKAYRHNNKNENRCKTLLKQFSNRVKLYKGDANDLSHLFEDQSFDFIHFDFISPLLTTEADLVRVMDNYLPKIKKGGYLIARDLHKDPFCGILIDNYNITMKPCIIKGKESIRLKYFIIT